MGSRRWVTCLGCGAPLLRPKRGAPLELHCPWCEATNPLTPPSAKASSRRGVIIATASVAILATVVPIVMAAWRGRPKSPATKAIPKTIVRGAPTKIAEEPIAEAWPTVTRSAPFATPPDLKLSLAPPPWIRDEPPTPPPLSIEHGDREIVPPIQPLRLGELPRPRLIGRPRNVLVGDARGHRVVARYEGDSGGGSIVTMPDGQLGRAEVLFPTDAPFEPIEAERLARELLEGPFVGFHSHTTAHYVVLSSGSDPYAEGTARLLESLYVGLADHLRRMGLRIHEAEFPMVAVIDGEEREFRARRAMPPEVQAYYDPLTNRIALYEISEQDAELPELSAMNKPRIVAHEGTHQILQNIGVQPRLAPWPAWLSEGLAEYCAPTSTNPDGTWKGCGTVNPLHMATLRDLDDPLARMVPKGTLLADSTPQPRGRAAIEALLTRAELRPTDYAVAWSLTYYLAQKRPREFQAYLARMSRSRPLDTPSPRERLAEFREVFGSNLARLDQNVRSHLSTRRGYPELPYYCVYFEQWQPDGTLVQDALASQSPAVIEQWLKDRDNPDAPAPSFHDVIPMPTKLAAALLLRYWGFEGDD